MKKILKFKKLIIVISIFFLSFNIITDYKQKEVQAFVIVDDALYWALGLLILSTGVVAISDLQVLDMGKTFYGGLTTEEAEEIVYDSEQRAIKITDNLKSAINTFAETLSTTDKFITSNNFISDVNSLKFEFDSIPYLSPGKDVTIFSGIVNKSESIYIQTDIGYSAYQSLAVGDKVYVKIRGQDGSSSTYNHIAIDYVRNGVYNYGGMQNFWRSAINKKVTFSIPKIFDNPTFSDNFKSIPYSLPQVKQGYNPTFTNDRLKEGTYIPIPEAIPTDTPISTESPLTWDNVKDNIKTIPVDTPVDTPIDTPIDTPTDGTGTGALDWLKGLIDSIINLLKGILDFLLGLLTSLLEGLKNLLLSLFVPRDTYFIDNFNSLKNDFGNRLNINSYTRLFDSDYNDSSIKDITINVFGQTVTIVKFSMYENFRTVINTLIYAFMFFLLAIYNYSQVYKLIRGSDYVSASSTITHMGGGLTNSDMNKIFNNERERIKLGDKK